MPEFPDVYGCGAANVAKVITPTVGNRRRAERQWIMTPQGTLPRAGQYVYLGADASERFARHPIMLLLVSPAQRVGSEAVLPSGEPSERWVTLRGWQLGPFGEPQLLREVRVHAVGVEVVPKPPAAGLVGV
jgi:hypothetical protein